MILHCPCGWTGVPTYEGGRVIRPIRYVRTPRGEVQVPGKNKGSRPSTRCPACRQARPELYGQIIHAEIERAARCLGLTK